MAAYTMAKDELHGCLSNKEVFLRQRAKAKWLKEGVKNTHFFHIAATMKRNEAKIFQIKDAARAKQLSTLKQNSYDSSLIPPLIPTLILSDQNASLSRILDEVKLKGAAQAMNMEGVVCPDGFGGIFCSVCWDIIKVKINAAHAFFCGHFLPLSWTSSL